MTAQIPKIRCESCYLRKLPGDPSIPDADRFIRGDGGRLYPICKDCFPGKPGVPLEEGMDFYLNVQELHDE